jgi:hypothetical protein
LQNNLLKVSNMKEEHENSGGYVDEYKELQRLAPLAVLETEHHDTTRK